MNITHDSYNDIKNKCEKYDIDTYDFIFEGNLYSLTNINEIITMSLEIKNKNKNVNMSSILNNLPSNLDNLIIHVSEREESKKAYYSPDKGIQFTRSVGGGMMGAGYMMGSTHSCFVEDYSYLVNYLSNLPSALKTINFFYIDIVENCKNEKQVSMNFKFISKINFPFNCEINLNINNDKYIFVNNEFKFVNSDNLYI